MSKTGEDLTRRDFLGATAGLAVLSATSAGAKERENTLLPSAERPSRE